MQAIRREFDQVMSNDDFRHWIDSKCHLSAAFSKDELTSWKIISFVRLFLGNETIYNMWVGDKISASVRNLLHDMNEDSPLWARGLRNRFICFGLFRNFTETDIDDLLKTKDLPPISKPESGFDAALLEVIQKAHFRYPYEFSLLLNALEKIRLIDRATGAYASGGIDDSVILMRKAFYAEKTECYKKRLRDAAQFFNDYKSAPLDDEEKVFAENAADGYCLANYVTEVLDLILELDLNGIGVLSANDIRETKEFLEIIKIMASQKES